GASGSAVTVAGTAVTTTTGLSQLNLYGATARVIASSSERRTPKFSNIEEFVSLLRQSTGVPRIRVSAIDTGGGTTGLSFGAWTGNTTSIRLTGADAYLQTGTNGSTLVKTNAITLSAFNTSNAALRTFSVSINGATAVTVVIPQAVYASINDLADAISLAMIQAGLSEGLLETTPTYSGGNIAGGISPSFSFPLRLYADKNSGTGALADLTDIKINFADTYGNTATGEISNLSSESTVTLTRSADLRFTLGLNLVQPPTATESITVDMPIAIPDWDGVLEFDSLIRVVLDDGVNHDLFISASSTTSNTSVEDYADLLTARIASAGLSSKLTIVVDTDLNTGISTLRFRTVAGSTNSLTVNIPAYSQDPVTKANAASGKLGFTTNTSATNTAALYTYGGLDNATLTVQTGSEPFTNSTGYILTGDTYIDITRPNGTHVVVRVPASDTTTNASLNDLIADINTAIPTGSQVTAVNNAGKLGFNFTGTATGTTTWSAILSKRVYLAAGTLPIIANNAINTTTGGFTLATDAFFTVQLPDGTLDYFQVSASDTTTNTSLQDLIDDINNGILAANSLTQAGTSAKVVAYIDTTAADNKLRFKLNSDFFPQGGSWNIQVDAQYTETKSNAAKDDLMLTSHDAESSRAILGVISSTLSTNADYQLSNNLAFDVTVNGSAYTSVSVSAANTTTNTSIGDLISDINTELMSTNITVSGSTYKVGQFVKAIAISGATRIQLALRDDAPIAILNLRFAPTSTVNNGFTELGFPAEESRIGIRGSDSTLSNIFLNGHAEVRNQDLSGTGDFGFVNFAFGHADLDVIADSTFNVSGSVTRVQDLMSAFGRNRTDYPSLSTSLTINNTTAAGITLSSLSFPNDPSSAFVGSSVGNLAFGANAKISITHQATGKGASSSIGAGTTNFNSLPAPELVFTDTNKTELLSRLAFEDIVTSLWRIGDMISDWMKHDPQGPYASKLFFVKSGLVDAYDFGLQFNLAIDEIVQNPPKSLQEIRRVLATALQLDESEIDLSITSSGSGSTFQSAVHIAFELVRTASATLPLFIDLASLADRSNNSGLVKQSLLGLSSLTGNPADPMEVEFSSLSKLTLDMDIVVVKDGVVVEPVAVIKDPTTGSFFETRFFLNGDSYTSDFAAGINHLRLGYSWIDDQGNVAVAPDDINDPITVAAATTQALSATYDGTISQPSLTATSNGSLIVDGIALAVGDLILIKNQTDATQNGLYSVSSIGSSTTTWSLARTTDSLEWLKVKVTRGSINGDTTFMIKDVPTVTVEAATTGALAGTFTDYKTDSDTSNDQFLPLFTASANGALVVDGITLAVGDLVLVKNQSSAVQNGVYQVIDTGSSTTKYKLTRMAIGDATLGRAAVTGGTVSGGTVSSPKNFFLTKGVVSAQTGALPRGVVALRPAAVAVNAEGVVALPDVYGTPQMYDDEAVTTDDPIAPAVTVNAATTADLNANFSSTNNTLTAKSNGALVIDGVTLTASQSVLINNQSDGAQNGIYTVTTAGNSTTAWVLTRSTAFDT
ncbi:MAG: hypothetical protein V4507_05765, partial [Verrucomicrobiota bacterium]